MIGGALWLQGAFFIGVKGIEIMSMEEKERHPRHVKKSKDLRKAVKSRDDKRWARAEIHRHKDR